METIQVDRRTALKRVGVSALVGMSVVGSSTGDARAASTSSPTDLGVIEEASRADDVNARNTIIGRSRKTVDGVTYRRGVRWPDTTTIEDLGTLRDDNTGDSFAQAINNRETIVGTAQTTNWARRAYRWTPDSGMEDLGTIGRDDDLSSFAFGLNDQGVVVGRSGTASGVRHAFRWTEREGMVDLGTLREDDEGQSTAIGITNQDVIFGHSDTDSGARHAFRWTETEGMVDLGTLNGIGDSVARDGNNLGVSVGRSFQTDDFDSRHAVRWKGDEIEDLGTLASDDSRYSEAFAVNNSGVITGFSGGDVTTGSARRTRAVRWIEGTIEDLGTLRADNSGFSDARGINSKGVIVGRSREANGTEVHATCWGC